MGKYLKGKYLSSLNCYVDCIEDFESLVGTDGVEILNYIVREESREKNWEQFKNHMDNWEIIADNQGQQMRYSYDLVENVIDYVNDSKRLDRKKLVSMLKDVLNQLDNY